MGYTLYIQKNIIIKNKDLDLPTSIEETLKSDSSFTSISRMMMTLDGWDICDLFQSYRNPDTNGSDWTEIDEDELKDFLRDVDNYNEEMFHTGGYQVYYTISESY